MPANLTPEYLKAEEQYKSAASPEEKLTGLEEMLRTIPKHKGTEKLQADLKSRLSRLRKEIQKHRTAGPTQKPFWVIDREGAGRVVLCGPPNSGKSELLARLTAAHPVVADYPFTTRVPLPGMMVYEDIQIQLIDTPPLAPESTEGWLPAMIKEADIAILLFDVNDPALLEQSEYVTAQFRDRGIPLNALDRPRLVVLGNKTDRPAAGGNFQAWQELFGECLNAEPFSVRNPECLLKLKQRIFELLDVVRVYTKAPGKKPEEGSTPFVLKRGSTILEAAAAVHKDLAAHFKFARVWGRPGADDRLRFDGQMVERSYLVEDGDLVEIHG